MIINGREIDSTVAAFDGCHKIYVAPKDQELGVFVDRMEKNGWSFGEDFYRIEGPETLRDMYIGSCPMRFIQRISVDAGGADVYEDIIPQCSFLDEEPLRADNKGAEREDRSGRHGEAGGDLRQGHKAAVLCGIAMGYDTNTKAPHQWETNALRVTQCKVCKSTK